MAEGPILAGDTTVRQPGREAVSGSQLTRHRDSEGVKEAGNVFRAPG